MKSKNLFATALFILAVFTLNAQAPQLINYQAVARNSAGNVLPNQTVTVRFTIHANTPTGAIAHLETDTLTTNQFGLFTATIGTHSAIPGGFAGIAWGYSPKYLQVELDPAAGTNFSDMGTSQLLSVPYALYAETSGDNSWLKDGNNIYNANSGNVGIGTVSSFYKLHIVDSVNDHIAGVKIENKGDGGLATIVWGNKTGSTGLVAKWSGDNNTAYNVQTANMLSIENYGGNLMLNAAGNNIYLGTNNGEPNLILTSTGNVGLGTITPAPSAALDINSTTGALLLPRMTTVQRDALTAVPGMVIYNTTNFKFQGYTTGGTATVNGPTITDTSAVNNFGTCQDAVQTFLAQNTGAVNKISVFAFASGGPNPIRYRLRTGNIPGSGALLDSVDINVPNVKGFLDVVFPTHPVLTAGQYYQLEVNTDHTATHCTWIYTTDTPYTDGDLYTYQGFPMNMWNTFGTHDLVFNVFQDLAVPAGWTDLH